jgi:gamma-glutamylcyclotransferase (GGCT)/AIG2-like uncharacterized protein YtfP
VIRRHAGGSGTAGALFAYGTLMFREVMAAVTGRDGSPVEAVLEGFERRRVRGASYPGIVPRAGGQVHGRLWRGITPEDLARLDRFEGSMYARQVHIVQTPSGPRKAWLYVVRPAQRWMLTSRDWEPAEFRDRVVARHGRGPRRG